MFLGRNPLYGRSRADAAGLRFLDAIIQVTTWRGHPFDRLEDAAECVMQHAFARTAPVAWIKTMNRHLDMDQIRSLSRHSGLLSYLSKTEPGTNSSETVRLTSPSRDEVSSRQQDA